MLADLPGGSFGLGTPERGSRAGGRTWRESPALGSRRLVDQHENSHHGINMAGRARPHGSLACHNRGRRGGSLNPLPRVRDGVAEGYRPRKLFFGGLAGKNGVAP